MTDSIQIGQFQCQQLFHPISDGRYYFSKESLFESVKFTYWYFVQELMALLVDGANREIWIF